MSYGGCWDALPHTPVDWELISFHGNGLGKTVKMRYNQNFLYRMREKVGSKLANVYRGGLPRCALKQVVRL